MRSRIVSSILALSLFVACATSPTGRKQIMLVPDSQMNLLGAQAFDQMKGQIPSDSDPALNSYVKCITTPLTEMAKDKLEVKSWETVVFKDDTANAFALPGGKIGVYTGIFKVAKNDGQLAAVLGHEVGHVIARHSGERMSQAVAAGLALEGTNLALGDAKSKGIIMAALGLGAQFGALLPWGRTQESEADVIGLNLMAQAGFDPRQSVELWKNMGAAGGSQPPEFMSTHPSHETRMQSLTEHMPEAMRIYQQAQATGRARKCERPAGR
jgi:predicted Zn-dependent protease